MTSEFKHNSFELKPKMKQGQEVSNLKEKKTLKFCESGNICNSILSQLAFVYFFWQWK